MDVLKKAITTELNLSNPDIQEIILKAVEEFGIPAEVQHVKTILRTIDGIIAVELYDLAIDSAICIISFLAINIKIPIQSLIGKLITRDVYGPERNRISTAYLNGLVRDAEYKVELEHVYKKWKKTRKFTIQRLKEIAIEIRKDRKKSNIAKIAGTAVSASGIVGGAAAIVLTGGIAAPAVAAASVGLVGGVAAFGTEVVTNQIVKGEKKNANTVVEEDRQNTHNFIKLLEKYKEQNELHLASADEIGKVILRFKEIQQESIKVTFVIGNSIREEIGYVEAIMKEVKIVKQNLKDVIFLFMNGGEMISKIVASFKTVGTYADDAIFGTLKNFSTGTKMAMAIGAIALVVDIATIVKTAMDMADGSPDEAADMVEKAAKELEELRIPKLKNVIINTKLEAANKRGLYIEGLPE